MASLGARDEKRRPAVVVGIDSFNDYYAPAMKRGRAQRLQKEFGYEVVEGDVCQADLIDALFKKHKFTHVVHLAAQAGVRYSITHPMTRAAGVGHIRSRGDAAAVTWIVRGDG